MKKVRLNMKLISTLNTVLFVPVTELCEMTGIAKSTWYDIRVSPDAITVQYLLALANGLHIPVRRFFSADDCMDIIGKRDEYVADPYVPCEYNCAALQELISSQRDKTWKEAAEVAGMGYQQLQKSLMTITRLPVPRLLSVCEAFSIDPFTLLIDPNRDAKHGKDGRTPHAILSEIADMHKDIAYLSGLYRKMTEKYEDVLEKYTRLLEAHKILLRRFNEHAGEHRIDMAAEDDVADKQTR